ncbi:little elongation complex subunit 2 [Centruroides vittatus]|uniref:little elongation complex subunit 2 n=1 Tax=Centruroides vittatus TaxID=120091 RepID=UPI00350F3B3B
MEDDDIKLDWNIEPIDGQDQFISVESYMKYSATNRVLLDNTYKYYANLFKDNTCLNKDICNNVVDEPEQPCQKKVKKIKTHEKKTSNIPFSTLTADEQAQYLQLFHKYSNQMVNVSSEKERKDIKLLAELHSKVVAEQKNFMEYQKSVSDSLTGYPLHPEIQRYVKELLKEKLESCLNYPHYYTILKKITISENISQDKHTTLHLIHKLLKLGKIPRLVMPTSGKNFVIERNYLKLSRRFPVSLRTKQLSQELPFKKPVSQDSIARNLADKYSADIIISLSGLKLLLISQKLEPDIEWELPIVIISSESEQSALTVPKKQIYIDKPVPSGIWCTVRKRKLYYKYAVKLHYTHFNPVKKEKCSQKNIQNDNQEREIAVLQDELFQSDFLQHETFGQSTSNEYKKSSLNVQENKKCGEKTMPKCDDDKDLRTEDNLKRNIEVETNQISEINNDDIETGKSPNSPISDICKDINLKRQHEKEEELTSEMNNRDMDSPESPSSKNNDIAKEIESDNGINLKQAKSDDVNTDPESKKRKLEDEHFIQQMTSDQRNTSSQINELEIAEDGIILESNSDDSKSLKENIQNLKILEVDHTAEKGLEQSTTENECQFNINNVSEDSEDDNLVIDENYTTPDVDVTNDISHTTISSPQNDADDDDNDESTTNKAVCLQNELNKTQDSDCSEVITNKTAECISFPDSINQETKKNGNKDTKISTLDEILCLQEEMLGTKTKPSLNKSQEKCEINTESDAYIEDPNKFISADSLQNENVTYNLWQLDELKLLLRSKLDCKDAVNHKPRFLFSKLEYQAQFGCEIVTERDLMNEWLTLLTHPKSTGLRVRTDVATSNVLLTEELTLEKLQHLTEKFHPERYLCWLKNLFNTLKELSDGQYLLTHQKCEDAITLYSSKKINNKRNDFDLHMAITQRLISLDDGLEAENINRIPWLPIDTDVITPLNIQSGRIPATFPPKRKYKPVSIQNKKKNKKKGRKNLKRKRKN